MRAISRSDFDVNGRFKFTRGEMQGFTNNSFRVADLIIPNYIWGDPVVSISDKAFRNNGLTSLIISDSVIFIGEEAFINNGLTSVNIGSNVSSIGRKAFGNNKLTHVTIPNNVTFIGESAFQGDVTREVGNVIRSIVIGANVDMIEDPFFNSYLDTRKDMDGIYKTFKFDLNSGFRKFYDQNDRKAGRYVRGRNTLGNILSGNAGWSYSPH